MDYSSVADQPVAKSFDNFIDGDAKGTFMLDNSAKFLWVLFVFRSFVCFTHGIIYLTNLDILLNGLDKN